MIKLKTIFFFIFTLIYLSINAQLSSVPEFPTATEVVTVYFDATGTGLEGYTGNVYAHTGVNLENGSQWQHVIGDWGNNTNQPLLTRISTDYYSLEISPSINDFYGVGGSEVVSALAMVLRSADGTQQSSDLTLNVYTVSNTVTLAQPSTSDIFSIGDSVQIQAVAMFADSLKIYFDDTLYFVIDSTVLNVKVPALAQGNTYFTIIGKNSTEADTIESYFFTRKQNIITELPADTEYGINYIDDNTVTLVLFAPFKDFVFLKGDFNNWEISLDYQMNLTPDSSTYWITLNGLTASEEYAYQYYIDAEFSIADPYTDKILDPWNDQYISATTYPNLKPYPDGGDEIVSVFQTAQTPYNWQIQDFQRLDNQDLIIYELHIRDFIAAHNYQTLIDTLNYLKSLGINAIELMPINEFEGNSSWGYNPSFYFAPDKYYGTKNKLKEFIDVCHQNGIAVIIDMVFNHSYGQSPLVKMYLDRSTWLVTPDNPWYNVQAPNPVYSWGYDFNHESQATVDFVDRAITYWLTEYKVDGYRFDFTKGFTNTGGDGWAYDQSRINILKHYYDVTQAVSDNSYLILEHFCDNTEETVLANYGMMIWGNSNHNYCQASMGYTSESDFSWTSYLQRNWDNPNLVAYMESHDEERVTFKNITYGNFSDDYDVKDPQTALQRMELVATFFITIPGPKMIWQFGELGYDISIDDPCRVCEKPILWNYLNDDDRKHVFDTYKQLIDLKLNHEVFRTTDFSLNVNSKVKTITLNGDTMSVYIIGNFDVETQTATPSFPHSGNWYEYFSQSQYTTGSLILAPGEYRIYTDKEIYANPVPAAVAPQASEVTISGVPLINTQLSGSYSFYDFNGDLEGETTFQWYISDFSDGRSKQIIDSANTQTLELTTDFYGKYIGFEVFPIAISNELAQGNKSTSSFIGPVSFAVTEPVIFPNPFEDELNFLNMQDYNQVIISDASGKLIDSFDINARNWITKSYSLQKGVYVVKIIGETIEKEFKIIRM
ncbi:MAG: T9SS type A sorting domain-containing protein [Bacteroidales bacterium]|nr:T9SS type A sorting domain-containing protein [Bacteroidales bacterium]